MSQLVTPREMANRVGEAFLPERMIGLTMDWVPEDVQGWFRLMAVKEWRSMGVIHDGGPGPDVDFTLGDVLNAPFDVSIAEWNV